MKSKDLMGQIVTVSAEFRRTYRKDYEINKVNPRAGWVVGKRTIYRGNVSYDADGWRTFEQTGSYECILVAYWPTMNPVKVPLDSFVLGGEPEHFNKGWREEWKEEQRQIMKDWPRRENGQWKSWAEMTKEERAGLYK